MLRALGALSRPPSPDPLRFSVDERSAVERCLAGWPGAGHYIVFCIGGTEADKDWGDQVLRSLSDRHSDLGVLAMGAEEEGQRSERLLEFWPGPTLNLCSRFQRPRQAGRVVLGRGGHKSLYTSDWVSRVPPSA